MTQDGELEVAHTTRVGMENKLVPTPTFNL